MKNLWLKNVRYAKNKSKMQNKTSVSMAVCMCVFIVFQAWDSIFSRYFFTIARKKCINDNNVHFAGRLPSRCEYCAYHAHAVFRL